MTMLVDAPVEADIPLRRNWRFQALWAGSAFALLGVEIADLAYPLVILAITGSPAVAGAFGAVQLTAGILAGLPAGALVDRWDRRRVLIGAEIARAAVVGSIALAAATDHLTVAHFMLVAAVLGAIQPLGGTARMLMIRAVVPPTQLTAALTQDEIRVAAAGLAGPPLAGVLIAIGRAVPFLACAFTYVLSLVAALVVRVDPKPASDPAASQEKPREKSHWLQGLRELWQQRTVRAALLMISLMNVGGPALYLAVIVLLKHDGASNRTIGFAMSGVALGGLLGAALVKPLHDAMGPGKLLIAVTAFLTALLPPLVLPFGPWWVGTVLGVSMLGVPALRVLIDVLIFRQVPDERRGRTIAAVMTVVTVGMPLGTALAGVALQVFGATGTILGLTALYAVTIAIALSDRTLRRAAWPASS